MRTLREYTDQMGIFKRRSYVGTAMEYDTYVITRYQTGSTTKEIVELPVESIRQLKSLLNDLCLPPNPNTP